MLNCTSTIQRSVKDGEDMRNECNVCGHINGHAPGCPEAPEPDLECCSECGSPIENGEEYFEVNNTKYCQNCLLDTFRRIMDYDIFTYEDYLVAKYDV